MLCACRQQFTYQVSAIAATAGVSSLAILATYYKFSYMTGPDSPFPWLDMAGTLALVVGGVAGMEMWARWAHRVLWHDFQPGWALHKSHHVPRVGPFEVRSFCAPVSGSSLSLPRVWQLRRTRPPGQYTAGVQAGSCQHYACRTPLSKSHSPLLCGVSMLVLFASCRTTHSLYIVTAVLFCPAGQRPVCHHECSASHCPDSVWLPYTHHDWQPVLWSWPGYHPVWHRVHVCA